MLPPAAVPGAQAGQPSLALLLPQLREAHIQAALPGEAELLGWQGMGDISRTAAGGGPAFH